MVDQRLWNLGEVCRTLLKGAESLTNVATVVVSFMQFVENFCSTGLTALRYCDIVGRTDSVDGLVRFVQWKDTREGGES